MQTLSDYNDALHFLLEFTDYEKVTKYKYDIATFNLDRVADLMAAIGNPHHAFRSVHVAGTKGKGSTSTMVQAILTAAGARTGLYTSPHLLRVEERMTVDGHLMSEQDFVRVVSALVPHTRAARTETPHLSPTYFELVTAAAFRHFAECRVDFGVVEVGLGGRLDATNVIVPEMSVITRVDFDHVDRLGDTLGKIALEKAGIIKPGVPVVCAAQEPEALGAITAVAKQRNAPVTFIGRDYRVLSVQTQADGRGAVTRFNLVTPNTVYHQLALRLLGAHQAQNAAAAVAAVEGLNRRCSLNIGEDAIREGLMSATLPARLELFNGAPGILLDGAHNAVSIRGLCHVLDNVFAGKRVVMVLGFSHDKDYRTMLRDLMPRSARVILTQSDSPRAADADSLADEARRIGGTDIAVCATPHEALVRARQAARPEDLICIAGSFFLAANVRPLLDASPTRPPSPQ